MPNIIITVINDISFDRRIHRISNSLIAAGYNVKVIGRKLPDSLPLQHRKFKQKRIICFFNKGKLFYFEYNFRLFFYLLFHSFDIVCAVDLDTLLPCYYVSKIKFKKIVFDAHEYFTEVPEVIHRPYIKKTWELLEKKIIPKLEYAYSVSDSIAEKYSEKYGIKFEVIRNVPVLIEHTPSIKTEKILIYQGSLNKGRALEQLIISLKNLPYKLILVGDGDIKNELVEMIKKNKLETKVIFYGRLNPQTLFDITGRAHIGLNLLDTEGLNNYYSLANKFFDYIHAEIPSISMDFPEYRKINEQFQVSILLKGLDMNEIQQAVNTLMQDENLYYSMVDNCRKAKKIFNWENEEKKLINFYQIIYPHQSSKSG